MDDAVDFLIVAGGSGTRMGADLPKQFLLLNQKPLLSHTLEGMYHSLPSASITLVLPESSHSYWRSLCTQYRISIPHRLVAGGETRFHSVQKGLTTLNPAGYVAIHDGVRPLISNDLIMRLLETAREKGNAVPVLPLADSIRQVEGDASKPMDRKAFVSVQTPQVFRTQEIQQAYTQDYHHFFTDDATVMEAMGHRIFLVAGDVQNIKVTTPFDLAVAATFLHQNR